MTIVAAALFVVGLTVGGLFSFDLFFCKVHKRPSAGFDFSRNAPSVIRTCYKLAGFAGSLIFGATLYWLFPEYHGGFYDRYFQMLYLAVPFWLALAIPYFYLVDRHMLEPRDGFWHLGMAMAFRWRQVDSRCIGQHLLGWLIKAFFLPLMFTYFCMDLEKFLTVELSDITTPARVFDLVYSLFYLVDVGFATLGYIASLRIVDAHFRSSEQTMLGWVVAMACYEPFASLVGRQYLAYESSLHWGDWFRDTPTAYALWGFLILALTAIYTWSTVVFGARFSNLSNRGIITSGPYRWTKHPAYLAKNLSWWLISMPFMVQGSLEESARLCLLLLLLNGIYLLRARTEERHLSADPEYARYARFIDQRGLFRFPRGRSFGRKTDGPEVGSG